MAFIDTSYFVGARKISGRERSEVSERIVWFINQYEPILLRDIFGYELFKIFEAETSDFDPDASPATIDTRWQNLIDGAEFTKNSKTNKYSGLRSIIGDYVYYKWHEDQQTQTIGFGEAKAKAENAEQANPAMKMITAWNAMSDNIYLLYDYLQANKDTYPEWEKQDKQSMLRKYRRNSGALFGM